MIALKTFSSASASIELLVVGAWWHRNLYNQVATYTMGWGLVLFMFAVSRGIYFENNGSSHSVCNVYWRDNSTFGNVYGVNC